MAPNQKVSMLQGTVLDIEKTGQKKKDEEGLVWEKCIFSLELIGFSRRTPNAEFPSHLKDKKIKLVRWCCFDWHYRKGVRKTLEPEETDAVLKGEPTDSVYW